jgi:hypothetical protein
MRSNFIEGFRLFTFKKLCERGVVVDCVPMTDCS